MKTSIYLLLALFYSLNIYAAQDSAPQKRHSLYQNARKIFNRKSSLGVEKTPRSERFEAYFLARNGASSSLAERKVFSTISQIFEEGKTQEEIIPGIKLFLAYLEHDLQALGFSEAQDDFNPEQEASRYFEMYRAEKALSQRKSLPEFSPEELRFVTRNSLGDYDLTKDHLDYIADVLASLFIFARQDAWSCEKAQVKVILRENKRYKENWTGENAPLYTQHCSSPLQRKVIRESQTAKPLPHEAKEFYGAALFPVRDSDIAHASFSSILFPRKKVYIHLKGHNLNQSGVFYAEFSRFQIRTLTPKDQDTLIALTDYRDMIDVLEDID